MPDQPMGPWGRGPGPRTWKMLLNKRKKGEVGREKKKEKKEKRRKKGGKEGEKEKGKVKKNCFLGQTN